MKQFLKDNSRPLLALFFVCTGVMHFIKPNTFIEITPKFLPKRRELVYVSGVLEILGGLGLLFPLTRRVAAKGLSTLLYAVLPANINMAVKKIDFGYIPHWLLWARLPLQFLLVTGINALAEESK